VREGNGTERGGAGRVIGQSPGLWKVSSRRSSPLITKPRGRFGSKQSRPRAYLIPPNRRFGPKPQCQTDRKFTRLLAVLVTNHFAGSWHRLSAAEPSKYPLAAASSGQLGISCKVLVGARSAANSHPRDFQFSTYSVRFHTACADCWLSWRRQPTHKGCLNLKKEETDCFRFSRFNVYNIKELRRLDVLCTVNTNSLAHWSHICAVSPPLQNHWAQLLGRL
jgi:hypothetical protein